MDTSGLLFIGGDNYLQGVPARNLTHEEVIKKGGYDALIKSGLYKRPEPVAEKTKKGKTEEPTNG